MTKAESLVRALKYATGAARVIRKKNDYHSLEELGREIDKHMHHIYRRAMIDNMLKDMNYYLQQAVEELEGNSGENITTDDLVTFLLENE